MADYVGQIKDEQSFTGLLFDPKGPWFILYLLFKSFAEDAAFNRYTDRHSRAAHYLTAMGKALIDDMIQALISRPARAKSESEADPSVRTSDLWERACSRRRWISHWGCRLT
ncbi:DUF3077 domain-containing protein [Pseudomonas sp. SWRI99]|uniref:DUF3077 domain-containing protein n=1 Tax=Pseudomonas sp. SWRI99 TaxID=2745506 RepID=UPI0016490438|nr:DUF3077 domain-containing protein [Pseudomonas sp. SWRI99]MBC3775085.1 DUF3077 domain-containing protein [Pseudomonas sp. SWRI99]